jgi:hypothetical protein
MTTDAEIIENLKDEIYSLKEQLRQLREDVAVQPDTTLVGILSHQQSSLMMAIYRKRLATYAYLDHITAQTGAYHRRHGPEDERNRTKVAVFKLREKLKPYGIEISVLRGMGYYLNDENKAKLEKLMERKDE